MPRGAASAAVITEHSAFEALAGEWDDLWARTPSATPFQAHAWVSAWAGAYVPAGDLVVVTVRDGDVLVAGAALHRVRRGFVRLLAPLGGVGQPAAPGAAGGGRADPPPYEDRGDPAPQAPQDRPARRAAQRGGSGRRPAGGHRPDPAARGPVAGPPREPRAPRRPVPQPPRERRRADDRPGPGGLRRVPGRRRAPGQRGRPDRPRAAGLLPGRHLASPAPAHRHRGPAGQQRPRTRRAAGEEGLLLPARHRGLQVPLAPGRGGGDAGHARPPRAPAVRRLLHGVRRVGDRAGHGTTCTPRAGARPRPRRHARPAHPPRAHVRLRPAPPRASPRAMPSRKSWSPTTTPTPPKTSMSTSRISAPAPMTSTRPGCMTGMAARRSRVATSRSAVTARTSPIAMREPWMASAS